MFDLTNKLIVRIQYFSIRSILLFITFSTLNYHKTVIIFSHFNHYIQSFFIIKFKVSQLVLENESLLVP